MGLLAVLAFMVAMVPLASACEPPPPCGPTSLNVWKEICSVRVCEVTGAVRVCGRIFILNDPWHPAHILDVADSVKAKWNSNDWTPLAEKDLIETTVILGPGGLRMIWFCITFEKGSFKSYRNVVGVHLLNHPTGDRWFFYRLSFEVP